MAIPHVRRYVQNFLEADPSTGDPSWDAVIEFWFDDRAAYDARASAGGMRAAADNPSFLDMERTAWAIVEERVPAE